MYLKGGETNKRKTS